MLIEHRLSPLLSNPLSKLASELIELIELIRSLIQLC